MKKMIIGLTLGMLIGSTSVALAAPSTVQATWGKFKIMVNGAMHLSPPSQLVYKGTTYLPVRDTADLLGYTTKYIPQTKTISFISRSEMKDDWMTFYDFQAVNKLTVQTQKDLENAYEVKDGEEVMFKLNASTLKDGDNTVIADYKGNQIRAKKVLGAIYLNEPDLKSAGYRIN
ncbi:hypothetical protein ACTHPF_20605 [Paenibacillus sp. SAF-054]|uniref:hypothetical protein n=1 Tax=unclassified Paenibacillus TaxID=185978 RepID=UPI003F816D0F